MPTGKLTKPGRRDFHPYIVDDSNKAKYVVKDRYEPTLTGIAISSENVDFRYGETVSFEIAERIGFPAGAFMIRAVGTEIDQKRLDTLIADKKIADDKATEEKRIAQELADAEEEARKRHFFLHQIYVKTVQALRRNAREKTETLYEGSTTTCIMTDANGEELVFGHSTWKAAEKNKLGIQISDDDVIEKVPNASRIFNEDARQFGTACAEVECLYFRTKDQITGITYSLAYDQNLNKSKAACTNCASMLERNSIIDLYDYRSAYSG